MITTEQIILNIKYENEILELIERQLRDAENSLTQSDLQGRVSAIVLTIQREMRRYSFEPQED